MVKLDSLIQPTKMKLLQTYLLLALSAFTISSNGQQKLRVGIIEYKSQEKVKQTFAPMINHLGAQLGTDAELEIVDENDLGFQLNRNDFDIGIFTVFPYLKAKIDFSRPLRFSQHI